ncbi:MAG: hypothetical protein J6K92_08205 [Oscillospiraceae bacterium]|nr:hypothetical protein [Oscillospiraceae bacterium]
MIALIIIAALILLIILICNIPVEAYIRFYGGKADIKVKYFFLSLYPRKEKPPKKGKKKRDKTDIPKDVQEAAENNTSEEKADNLSADESTSPDEDKPEKEEIPSAENDSPKKERSPKEKKPPLLERINSKLDELAEKKNQVSLLIELVMPHLKRFGSKLRIDDIIIDFAAANEDAAKAAVTYGEIGAAVYNGIAFLRQFVSMSVRSVNISCLYNTPAEKSRYDGECKLRLRPASLINAVLAVCFGYISNTKKYSPVMELFKKG